MHNVVAKALITALTLLVADRCSAEERLVGRVYSVADLVVADQGRLLDARLMMVLQKMTSPRSWEGAGGRGTVTFFPLGMALVVRQTPAVHQEVEALLKSLRTAPIPWDRLR